MNSTYYDDIVDDVTITPSTGWVRWMGKGSHDYGGISFINADAINIPLVLNQAFIFREPGHYEITVTTQRVRGETFTTNTVGIDIAARSQADEAALVKTLDAAIATASPKEQRRAALELAQLMGDEAARAKVKWILEGSQEIAWPMIHGLAATRNQALQLQLLKAAWKDIARSPSNYVQMALRQVEELSRRQTLNTWTNNAPSPAEAAATRELDAEYHNDLDRMIATLPQRTGNNRRDTAYFLMESNQLSEDQIARVKPVVLEEFPHMDSMAQTMLLQTKWPALRDPSLAPALRAMLERKMTYAESAEATQRLAELDSQGARPYVIRLICRPEGATLVRRLKDVVKEDRIPEVDTCLGALLAKGETRQHDMVWEQAAERAARFATPAVLPQAKATWTNPAQDPLMLALFLRDSPKEAVDLLQREPGINWYQADTVYQSLEGAFPAEVLTWLRSRNPLENVSVPYQLAQFGEPQDRDLLRRWLDEVRSEWSGRAEDLKDPPPGSPAMKAKKAEAELIGSLLRARPWKLTEEEMQKITAGCMSNWCSNYAPRLQPAH